MNKVILISTALVALAIPLVPGSAATQCNATTIHIGGGPYGPLEDRPYEPGCCNGPVVPITDGTSQYYLNVRVPVHERITHEPHPNNVWMQDPYGGTFSWLATGDPAPVDMGSSDVAIDSKDASVWLYVESNGVAGLQRGGSSGAFEDTCVDPGYAFPDEIVV